ncbi:MAG: adenylate/guanylate cyclase domain-containing protein [Spirochaetota bacterium]
MENLKSEISANITKVLPRLSFCYVFLICYYSPNPWLSFALGISIPLVNVPIVWYSQKTSLPLTDYAIILNALLLFALSYFSGESSPVWLFGINIIFASHFNVSSKWKNVSILSVTTAILIGMYLAGKAIPELIGIAFAIVAVSLYSSRIFRLLIKKNAALQEERRHSERLLENILPLSIIDELQKDGSVSPKKHPQVTVLFTDFVGFTQAAAQMSPESLVSTLDAQFKKFDEIISMYQLEKIKTIGDAYMCAGGIFSNPIVAAKNVARAALAIRDFMATNHSAWQVRLGMHTGEVVAGVVGSKKFAYDIWGDTVNTASRLESSSEPGGINISQASYKLIQENFHCQARGKLTVKSKGELEMYFIVSEKEKTR